MYEIWLPNNYILYCKSSATTRQGEKEKNVS